MITKDELLSGKAVFHVRNAAGETIHVKVTKAPQKMDYRGRPYDPSWYVTMATTNTATDGVTKVYQYVGVLDEHGTLKTTGKSMFTLSDRSVRIVQWALGVILSGQYPPLGYYIESGATTTTGAV